MSDTEAKEYMKTFLMMASSSSRLLNLAISATKVQIHTTWTNRPVKFDRQGLDKGYVGLIASQVLAGGKIPLENILLPICFLQRVCTLFDYDVCSGGDGINMLEVVVAEWWNAKPFGNYLAYCR